MSGRPGKLVQLHKMILELVIFFFHGWDQGICCCCHVDAHYGETVTTSSETAPTWVCSTTYSANVSISQFAYLYFFTLVQNHPKQAQKNWIRWIFSPPPKAFYRYDSPKWASIQGDGNTASVFHRMLCFTVCLYTCARFSVCCLLVQCRTCPSVSSLAAL